MLVPQSSKPLTQTANHSVFQTSGERRTQFFSDLMCLGRIPALLNKSAFPSAAYKGSLFEESFIKATQIKLQDLSCYFYTLIIYYSSSCELVNICFVCSSQSPMKGKSHWATSAWYIWPLAPALGLVKSLGWNYHPDVFVRQHPFMVVWK